MKTLKLLVALFAFGLLCGCEEEPLLSDKPIYCESGWEYTSPGSYVVTDARFGATLEEAKESALSSCALKAGRPSDCVVLKCKNMLTDEVLYQR